MVIHWLAPLKTNGVRDSRSQEARQVSPCGADPHGPRAGHASF